MRANFFIRVDSRAFAVDYFRSCLMKNRSEEIRRLQGCINDLVSLLALPALWIGREPPEVASTLLDVLLKMLRLDSRPCSESPSTTRSKQHV